MIALIAALIVAGPHGVVEVGDDGAIVRTLSKTAGNHPRWSPDHQRIFFLSPGRVRVVNADGSGERTFARLPKQVKLCEDVDETPKGTAKAVSELAVQSDSDFLVTASGICLKLQDRNDNMVGVALSMSIDLATGKVQKKLTEPECPGDAVAECPYPESAKTAAHGAFDFDFDKESHVVHREGDKLTVVRKLGGEFAAEAYSPSGRWLALRGNEAEGDYIHYDLLVLDRQSGDVWPVREKKLRALTPKEQTRYGKKKIDTVDTVAESAIRWLEGDRLLVDSLLVVPGKSAVQLPGDVAP